MRLFRMYPEVFQADSTHGTNREMEEPFDLASVGDNNIDFNAARV